MPDDRIPSPDQVDAQELIALVDQAQELFTSACVSFSDLRAVFEAIAVASPPGSLSARLASLGVSLCEARGVEFDRHQCAYMTHADRFTASLGTVTEVNHD
ncbi:hypothetical protein ABH944_007777 [Caballeronia udeis]|uniref:Uncharacterized protein n=1 Tax=Caballeronia udeis TaxID=1232866 RepID=A0ABW8MUT3_9BURK